MTNGQSNTDLVLALLDQVFNQHDPAGAAERYMAEDYIQHNPDGETGRAGFLESIGALVLEYPRMSMEFHRTLEQGDLVAVHIHWKREPSDRGFAVADLFRIEDGRVVEHWDVIQEIPEVANNDNGMF